MAVTSILQSPVLLEMQSLVIAIGQEPLLKKSPQCPWHGLPVFCSHVCPGKVITVLQRRKFLFPLLEITCAVATGLPGTLCPGPHGP